MSTPVTPDQFELSPAGITHLPTGAAFTPHPGNPLSGNMRVGRLGSRLKNGDDHRPDEVRTMMERLWTEYVAQHPYAFEQ